MHTKNLGVIGELKATAKLIELGYNVFTSVGDNSEIDLIAEKNGILKKIQVKSTMKVSDSGKMEWVLGKSRLNYKGGYKEHYQYIDAYILYCFENDYLGIINFEDCSNTSSVSLRIETPKNNQTANIRMASDYNMDG